ncbi:hypothetical protein [Xanthomonas euroxanthea]|nr:hypothetical protein [Xanthomonas euroxanthea]
MISRSAMADAGSVSAIALHDRRDPEKTLLVLVQVIRASAAPSH